MTRRAAPRLSKADLKDHADAARVERIWERIETDLSFREPTSRKRSVVWALSIAAALTAFAGGIFVGRGFSDGGAQVAVVASPTTDRTQVDVLAAGEEGRDFDLPGGGKLMLKPGTTIEVQRTGSDLQLKLVQGDAMLETAQSTPAIIAGEARLNAQAGSTLSVSRRLDNMDVGVSKGGASLDSPMVSKKLTSGDNVSVPLHRTTASDIHRTADIDIAKGTVASSHSHSSHHVNEVAAAESLGMAPGPVAEWQKLANGGDYPKAFTLLKEQPGGVDAAIHAAQSAGVLYEIRDVARKGGDPGAATRALTRIVDDFPADQLAQLAASDLCGQYSAKDPDKAQKYCERAKNVSESAPCNLMAAKQRSGHKDEAIRLAKEYVKAHADGAGQCIEEAERIASGGDAADASAPSSKPVDKMENKDKADGGVQPTP